MLEVMQKLINRKFPIIAPFNAAKLTGNKSGFLYSKKSGIDCRFDFYYIKFGVVYSTNAYYFCLSEEHKKMKALFGNNSKNINMPSPKDYFIIVDYFNLKPDYNTYKDVVTQWMRSVDYLFYEDIEDCELPDKMPDSFKKIVDDVKAERELWLEGAEPAEEGMLYADLFTINDKVCLITGSGKSDACKAISSGEGSYDYIMFKKGDRGLECLSHVDCQYSQIDYCIHMDSINFEKIREVDYYEYIRKASGNVRICGTNIPSFYQLLKCSTCKMIVVPYTDTLEDKSEMLKSYLSQ